MINKIISLYENSKFSADTINKVIVKKLNNSEIRKALIGNIPRISLYMKEEDMESYKRLIREMLKYDDIRDGIKNRWCTIIHNCDNGISLIEPFTEYPEIKEDMQKKVEDIIAYSNWKDFQSLVQGLAYVDNNALIMKEYLEKSFLDDAIDYGEEEELAEEIIKYKGLKEKEKYINYIIGKTKKYDEIAELIYECKDTEANSVYDEHKGIMRLYEASLKNDNIEKEVPQVIIGYIIANDMEEDINALVEACGGENSEILSHGEGLHSLTYDINGKHLKIEIGINNFQIQKNHRRFLQPYIRKQKKDICMEVYETHDNNHDEITDEELLEVFKELYNDGLFWADAKQENLVRLVKDNKPPDYIKQRDDTIYGFKEHTNNLDVLKKGKVVVCDLDYIYSIDSPEYKNGTYRRGRLLPMIKILEENLKQERDRKNEGR